MERKDHVRASIRIRQLVQFTISDTENIHKEATIGKLSRKHASIFYNEIKINIRRSPKIIDSSAIRHTIRKHGNSISELKRGQIAVTYKDFELLPNITANPTTVEYKGKNSLKQDVYCFSKRIGNMYFAIFAIRLAKKRNKVIFTTLYIRK